MKNKGYKEKYSKKVNKKPIQDKKKVDKKWMFIISIISYLLLLVLFLI